MLPPNHLLPQNVCLQLSPQPNTTTKEFNSRSYFGLERKVRWTQLIGMETGGQPVPASYDQ